MLLEIIYTCLLIVTLAYLTWKKWTARYSSIPCPFSIPWFGSAPFLERDSHKLFVQLMKLSEKYDALFLLWIGPTPVICSGRAEHAEYILSSNTIIKKSNFYNFLQDWLGLGLLLSSGEKWRMRRKAITPSFHFSIMNSFYDIFIDHSKVLVEKLCLSAKLNETVDIQEFARLATLDVICETAMGVKIDSQFTNSEYANTISFVNKQLLMRMRSPWLWPTVLYRLTPSGRLFYDKLKLLHEFTINIINERIKANETKAELSPTFTSKKAFLDTLLELYSEGKIDIDGIREEVDTFMFGGHDTTASAFSWIMYLLGRHPDVQKKLQKEIDSSLTTSCSYLEKINSVKYLEYVVKEGLRLHAPVLFFARLIEEETTIAGMNIPEGTQILIAPGGLHLNPNYWTNPLDFLPERFGEEEYYKRNPYVYVPFSAGPRNCVGQKFAMMELKIMVYHVMQKLSVNSLQVEDDVECIMDVIHHSRNGLMLEIFERKCK